MDFNKIKNRQESIKYQYFKFGNDYYIARNTNIVERKKRIYLDGIGVTANPFGANHKIPSGHFKKIVDQKVLYQLANGVMFEDNQNIDDYFKEAFNEIIIDLGIGASKKSETWLLAYKDNGKLKFTQIPVEQLTPSFDEYGNLIEMLRCFQDGNDSWVYQYTDTEIIRYCKKSKEKDYKVQDIIGHWTTYKEFGGEQIGPPELHSFSTVPFIPLYNNREHLSDLFNIKKLIDIYDIITSDFANNIDDMQDAYFTLKGYEGSTKGLGEFMKQLKMYKAVPVSEDGAVESHQLQIPTEARKVFLEQLEKSIYKYAMAVDLNYMSGGSITNVYIKAMFADLDLKCNQFESELRKFISHLIEFININDNKSLSSKCAFVRETIVNTTETVDNLVNLTSLVSDKTLRELVPFDIDVEQEEIRIKDQQGEMIISDE